METYDALEHNIIALFTLETACITWAHEGDFIDGTNGLYFLRTSQWCEFKAS